jgi:hypothetical protein
MLLEVLGSAEYGIRLDCRWENLLLCNLGWFMRSTSAPLHQVEQTTNQSTISKGIWNSLGETAHVM